MRNTYLGKNLISENHRVRNSQQRLQAIRGKLACKKVRTRVARPPESLNQLRHHFLGSISIRMPFHSASPVNLSQGIPSTPIRILHIQQRRKIMLLGVTSVRTITRKLKLPPQDPIFDSQQRMSPRHDKKLRTNSELLKRNLGEHSVPPPSVVPFPEPRLVGDELDEGPKQDPDASRTRIRVGLIERRGFEEGGVDVAEGMQRDAVLGEDCEVSVGGVVEEGRCEEAARRGDERR